MNFYNKIVMVLMIIILLLSVRTQSCDFCKKCSSSPRRGCLVCYSGYYLAANVCNKCSTGCSSCNDSLSCLACNEGYYQLNSSCYECAQGCQNCSSDLFCLACSPQYFKKEGKCRKCSTGCRNCSDENLCLECQEGFYLENDKCVTCSLNCQRCLTGLNCLSCFENAFLDVEGVCQSCSDNCIGCKNQSLCTMCETGFYLEIGKCLSCPNSCSNCTIQGSCIRCGIHYICEQTCVKSFLINKCLKISQDHEKNYTSIIISVVVAVFLFCCIILKGIITYRNKNGLSLNAPSQNTVHGQTSMRDFSTLLGITWTAMNFQDLDFISECCICQEKGVNVATSCNHMFHMPCISLWMQKNFSCPICRNNKIQNIKIYCCMCHRFFIEKELKDSQVFKFSSSLELCDFCKAI